MSRIAEKINKYTTELNTTTAKLVAISKTKPEADIMEAYEAGQRIFGENQVQEMARKYEALPKDIEWHLVGHLQSNKVKYIAPFVSLIHSVDSLSLMAEINKQAIKNKRVIDCLLQIYIADEDTKYGLDFAEVVELMSSEDFKSFENIRIVGLMGIATNTPNKDTIDMEFYELTSFFKSIKMAYFADKTYFKELSMGMSADYDIAIHHGSTLVRIGSDIFGERNTVILN